MDFSQVLMKSLEEQDSEILRFAYIFSLSLGRKLDGRKNEYHSYIGFYWTHSTV